jgi:hypothetical protein
MREHMAAEFGNGFAGVPSVCGTRAALFRPAVRVEENRPPESKGSDSEKRKSTLLMTELLREGKQAHRALALPDTGLYLSAKD